VPLESGGAGACHGNGAEANEQWRSYERKCGRAKL
jgi:hypothetical protein